MTIGLVPLFFFVLFVNFVVQFFDFNFPSGAKRRAPPDGIIPFAAT